LKKSKKIEITLIAEVIIRDDKNLETLLKKETEYLAEPQSANGCVKPDIKFKSFKLI